MLQETYTLYRLTILYLLFRAKCPVSANMLTGFLLTDDFVDYFNLQQIIGELMDDGLVSCEKTHGKTLYSITPAGEQSWLLFSGKLSKAIKKDVDDYLSSHNSQLKDDISVLSKYYDLDASHYVVNMYIEESGHKLLELNVTVSSAEEAEQMCSRWLAKGEALYPVIMGELIK